MPKVKAIRNVSFLSKPNEHRPSSRLFPLCLLLHFNRPLKKRSRIQLAGFAPLCLVPNQPISRSLTPPPQNTRAPRVRSDQRWIGQKAVKSLTSLPAGPHSIDPPQAAGHRRPISFSGPEVRRKKTPAPHTRGALALLALRSRSFLAGDIRLRFGWASSDNSNPLTPARQPPHPPSFKSGRPGMARVWASVTALLSLLLVPGATAGDGACTIYTCA